MEYINGEFVMTGCEPDDPHIIRTAEDCVNYIHSVGFLPLFSNTIPGFSVEEHTLASQWWTEDPETDPWVWRQILSSDPTIAYGKLFNRTAGFISKAFFPTFANYRRNGYDFDALFEDELASYRAKKIMDVFELDEEAVGKAIMSSEIKQLAGFSKDGGEKNFEGAITDLQMQTYLIMGSFQQKKNKKGQSYGWHIAVMETPETKWGRDFVTSAYSEDPAESWKKIVARMKEEYPDATDELIWKMLGIKYPGVEIAAPIKKKKAVERKTSRPQELPWPENLITEIGLKLIFPETGKYTDLSDDQNVGLIHATSTLKDNEQDAIRLRYEEHKTLQETADKFGLSKERIRQITNKGIRKLRSPLRLCFIVDGYQGTLDKRAALKKACREEADEENKRELLNQVKLSECGLSTRACNALISYKGDDTLAGLVEMLKEEPVKLTQIWSLGKQSQIEVIEKLEDYGLDCYDIRVACGFASERREDIMELDPSVRLFNILYRAGLDTVSKVEKAIQEQPMELLRLNGLGKKTAAELLEKMEKVGVDCAPIREAAKWLGWEL